MHAASVKNHHQFTSHLTQGGAESVKFGCKWFLNGVHSTATSVQVQNHGKIYGYCT